MDNDNRKVDDCQTLPYFSVYVLYCVTTEKYYVGVTRQIPVYTRIRQHKKGKQFIDREIQRTGWHNWDWWIVEKHVPANLITEREQYWIATFDSVYPHGYNKTLGGIAYITVSEDTRAKISKAALERDMSGENNPMYGKHHTDEAKAAISESRKRENLSDETLAKMSEAQKGKTLSAKTRAKLSEAQTGEKNHFFGKHHTEESKEKNRQAHLGKVPWNKGKPASEETKAKLRAKALERDMSGENNPFYGKHHTEESKEKNRQAHLGQVPWNKGKPASEKARAQMSESHKGKKLSEKTRAKISAAIKGENHPMYGKHHSEETKAKLREKALARAAAKRAAKAAEVAAAQITP